MRWLLNLTLTLLVAAPCWAADLSDARLKTHKLKGQLKASLACSAGHDCRIVFSIVQHEGKDAILLETVGTHDEVY